MGTKHPRPVVLDAGALIAVDRADRRIIRLRELAEDINVLASALAQVWRHPARQVRLGRVASSDGVTIHPLDAAGTQAAASSVQLGRHPDVVGASVVLVARIVGGVVVTSDAAGLRRMDPGIGLVDC